MNSTASVQSTTPLGAGTPLGPVDPHVRAEIEYRAAPPIKGGELVYSILRGIAWCWREDNVPLTQTVGLRFPPFLQIAHVVAPNPAVAVTMTPLKTGFMYLQILDRLLRLDGGWPGGIRATGRLTSHLVSFGFIDISTDLLGLPTRGGGLVTSRRNDTLSAKPSNGTSQAIVESGISSSSRLLARAATPIKDKDWLSCFSKVLILAFTKRWNEVVQRTLGPDRPYLFHSYNEKAMAILHIRSLPHGIFLIWGTVVNGLLQALADWASADVWQSAKDIMIFFQGNLALSMSIEPWTRPAGGAADSTSITVAAS